MKDTMRTPSGDYKSIGEAVEEWESIAKPLSDLGFEIHGYDPGVSFRSKECKGNLSVFSIACSDLKIINEAIKR